MSYQSLWVGEFVHDLSAIRNPSFFLVSIVSPCTLWLRQLDLFLYSIWDKVIAGSCMILVYVAVAVLLSVRRKILGLQTREEILHLLNKVI